MKIYSLLKLAGGNRIPARVKILGLAAMHMFGRRVAGVFVDPVLACNLRCRMCYFSDPAKRAEAVGGVMTDDEIQVMARALFPRALKLQIGCAAEPTLWSEKKLIALIELGRSYGVPYLSLTSNGQRIASGDVRLRELVQAGLCELTLSMHGTTAEVYEELMPGAHFDNLRSLLEIVAEVKRDYPQFKLRINFTVNSLNIAELTVERFRALMPAGFWPDILQIRPVQKLGETSWNDFSHERIKELYPSTIDPLIEESHRRGAVCLAPSYAEIDAVTSTQESASAVIEDFTYCYVASGSCYKEDFHPAEETFSQYHSRQRTLRKLLRTVVNPSSASRKANATKKLNYHVK